MTETIHYLTERFVQLSATRTELQDQLGEVEKEIETVERSLTEQNHIEDQKRTV